VFVGSGFIVTGIVWNIIAEKRQQSTLPRQQLPQQQD
jgi:hypothetical protein